MKWIETISGRGAILWPWIFLLAGLSGCMQPFSKSVMASVDRDRTFYVVIENPRAYIGSIVLWGGIIEKALPESGGTRLIVTQTPLDSKGYPQTDTTYGEFIAYTSQTLDRPIFRRGALVTIAGEIDGVQEKETGSMEYPRPIVRIIEIHPWGGNSGGSPLPPEEIRSIGPVSFPRRLRALDKGIGVQ